MKKGFVKCLSAVLTLCMVLSCMSFAFTTVGAATIDESGSETEAVSASSADDGFSWDNATVYFLLTDRFKNGNTSNDHSYNRGLDQSGNVVSLSDTRGSFHGGDFAGVTQTINDGYFNDLGVNAIWISAPYEQIHGYVVGNNTSPSFAHYSYHGYYVLDYTQTDANFGTAEEFETLVDTAHSHGLRVILDIVMNHAGYNSVYDMAEYGFGTVKSGWESTYYNFSNISNETYHTHIDYDSNAADWAKWWGTDWIRCGVAGYTPGGSDEQTRCLESLPDFMTESSKTVGIPQLMQTKWTKEGRLTQETNELNAYFSKTGKQRTVTNTLSYWLSTWVRDYGVDGFRCDTAKHVDLGSWKTLKDTCVDALKEWRSNNPDKPGADWDEDFWMTGECWDHGVSKDGYYTQGGFDSMLNFSTLGGSAFSQSNVQSTYNSYAQQINTDDSFNALSFMSSHDSNLTRGDMKAIGSAFLMLPGGVQMFYGDETNRQLVSGIPFDGNGGPGHSLRSDMNWNSMDEGVLEHWQKVGTFRNNHISVGAGANSNLTTTAGYAFGRTYNKNGVTDKIAGCIYAGSNSNVTIDVSSLWADGQSLVNAYDQSSAQVQNGKVTFNSGASGTILIEEPDGRPLMSVSGNAKFKDSQTVTVSLENCETAKCSVDGGNKFIVQNGSTFSIGATAYDGDTIKVVLEATNENGSSESTASFLKIANSEELTEPSTAPTEAANDVLYVKTWDGSAPYAYVWTGESNALNGAWPGKQLTQKNSDGYYVLNLNSKESFNVVLNNGNGTQSDDITGLSGEVYYEVTGSNYACKKVTPGGGGGGEVTEDSVIIRVKSFDGSAPNLYVWNDGGALNGAWPGTKLSEKDADGNYIFTAANTSSCNVIVNNGSGQTSDITDLGGDVLIEITNAGCTTYKLTKNEAPVSGMALLKKEARAVKAMTASDYTSSSWTTVSNMMPSVDALVALGDSANEDDITGTIATLQSAKAALKLAQPKLYYAVAGQSKITGVVAPAADVTVNVNGTSYKTTADDVTGAVSVNASVSSSSTIKIDVTRNGLSADTYTYNMSSGNINSGEVPTSPTLPTTPVTSPTTPTTAPTTAATTAPTSPTQDTTMYPPMGVLNVTATSNIFPESNSGSFDKIYITYNLKSAMNLVNGQWKLTYDSSKLKLNTELSSDIMPNISNELTNATDGAIYGNFSSVDTYDFTSSKAFVTVCFDVLTISDFATVNLEVQELSVGYISNGMLNFANAVVGGVQKDLSNVAGFASSKLTTTSVTSNEPTTTEPTTQAPTTAPTTVPTTEPTTAPSDTLKVTAKSTSNIFPEASETYDAADGTVTVSYKLSSNMQVENGQWKLTYDTSKLKYDAAKNKVNNVQTIMPVIGTDLVYNAKSDYIKGNFTSLKLFTFDSNAEFVTVTFDIIGTGEATVNLDLEILSLGYVDDESGEVRDASIVDYSELQNISGVSGFANAAINTNTVFVVNVLLGDADGNGEVDISDVTYIQSNSAELVQMTATQKKCADVDGDGKVTITDATMIQKYLAGQIASLG